MLAGVNDRYEQALALARTLSGRARADEPPIFKVNLIPYNPTEARSVRRLDPRVDRRVPRGP